MNQFDDQNDYLVFLNQIWQSHCELMVLVRSIFLPLDRKYASATNGVLPIWELGLEIFKSFLVSLPEINQTTITYILKQVENERNHETINRVCIRSLIRMYTSLGMYHSHFENSFLDATHVYYLRERDQCFLDFDPSLYISKIDQRTKEEKDRIANYLDDSTSSKVLQILDDVFLCSLIDSVISKVLNPLLDQHKLSDITLFYSFVQRVGYLDKLKIEWKQYILKKGSTLMAGEENIGLIDQIIFFKTAMNEILENCFRRNDMFSAGLKDSFEHFINQKKDTPSELLAKYIDKKLRSGNKVSSDYELENLLDKVMHVFRYLNGKDVFEAFYKKDLAKRLLLQKSLSIDAEKSMIMRLRSECGSDFTQKLEGMFKDINLSKDISAEFKSSYLYKDCQLNLELDIFVLTTSFWPNYLPINLKLPNEMSIIQDLFTKFYIEKHSGRHLVWLNGQGICIAKAKFGPTRKELLLSTIQAVLLMLFNESSDLSFRDIKIGTGIDDEEELKRSLISLYKSKILLKESKSKIIGNDDMFQVNEKFKTKQFRVVLNQAQTKETQKEIEKTHESIYIDRQYQIDAAIVRIMKTRKTLNHTDLVTELYHQLKFPLQVSDIKKRIEVLIEKEYLSRNPDDNTIYNYIS